MSVGMGRSFETVCLLFVCLSFCPQHNSKTNDPKVFELCAVKDLDGIYYRSDMVLELKGQRSRSQGQ